ncbi:unnamed protein product [Pleuronectes platessa]|uniref:Uncharacterized protein n=1 Tax=Pleuronectes platessa TaxID=8262 RepID=A0A9N7YP64_PLEPL|nr:unnamed protein product [Pleuronectes platessa]
MNEKVQENISLTTEPHLHHLESQKVECDLKVKYAILKDKLKTSLRNEERSLQEKVYLIEWLERRKKRIWDLEKENQRLLLQIPKPVFQTFESPNFTKYSDNVKATKEKIKQLERERRRRRWEVGGGESGTPVFSLNSGARSLDIFRRPHTSVLVMLLPRPHRSMPCYLHRSFSG